MTTSMGATLVVSNGATASAVKVKKGGEIVYAGGTFVAPKISAGALAGIAPGTTVSGMVVRTGVTMLVSSGGTASSTILRNGTEIVSAGGKVAGTTTMSGISDLSVAARGNILLTVSGFAPGDILRLAGYRFGPSETLTFVENAAHTKGTLTVTSGTVKATVTLFGQYVAAGFNLSSDGDVGTVITYSGTTVGTALAGLAAKHG
jgi:autotransporter passenger strand-loop-strand repeat protein